MLIVILKNLPEVHCICLCIRIQCEQKHIVVTYKSEEELYTMFSVIEKETNRKRQKGRRRGRER